MNAFEPPFDPPYVTTVRTEAGVSRFETLADGTTRPVSTPAVDIASSSTVQRAPSASAGRTFAGARMTPVADNGGRTFLSVPFAEKDEAKGIGARWDAARKKWYVPQGLDLALFARWNADMEE